MSASVCGRTEKKTKCHRGLIHVAGYIQVTAARTTLGDGGGKVGNSPLCSVGPLGCHSALNTSNWFLPFILSPFCLSTAYGGERCVCERGTASTKDTHVIEAISGWGQANLTWCTHDKHTHTHTHTCWPWMHWMSERVGGRGFCTMFIKGY